MCGRYTAFCDENEEIKQIYRNLSESHPNIMLKTGKIFPTDTVPVLTGEKFTPIPAIWGFPTYSGKGVLINARAESATEKRTFRDSTLERRCVIPTTGFYEWDKQKTKYLFRLPNTKILYIAGFYKIIDGAVRFVILTTAANNSMPSVHDRMPVILSEDAIEFWNCDTNFSLEFMKSEMSELVLSFA